MIICLECIAVTLPRTISFFLPVSVLAHTPSLADQLHSGQLIDAALLRTGLWTLGPALLEATPSDDCGGPSGTAPALFPPDYSSKPTQGPLYQPYAAQDGWVMLLGLGTLEEEKAYSAAVSSALDLTGPLTTGKLTTACSRHRRDALVQLLCSAGAPRCGKNN